MFYDLEPIIFKALISNEKIVDYVAKTKEGFPNIAANRVPGGNFPLIVFHKIHGSTEIFGSDEELLKQLDYQIVIFTHKNDYSLIQDEIDTVMQSIGFHCYNDYTISIDDTKTIHRVFTYSIRVNEQLYNEITKKFNVQIGE